MAGLYDPQVAGHATSARLASFFKWPWNLLTIPIGGLIKYKLWLNFLTKDCFPQVQHIFFTTYAQIDLIFFSINYQSRLKIARSDHCSTDEKLQILFCLKLRTQESIFMKGKLAMPHLVWILVVAEFLSALHCLGYRSSNRPCLRTYNLKNERG